MKPIVKNLLVAAIVFSVYALPNSVLAADVAHTGSYSVPVTSDLAGYASYTNTFTVGTNTAGKLTLEYVLPAELVGNSTTKIYLTEVSQDAGLINMASATHNDSASCRQTDASLVCFVLYPELSIDQKDVLNVLKGKFTDPKELQNRLHVASIFASDPKGVVYAPLK